MKKTNILQISAPKTGSFWLNTILKQILSRKGIPVESFIQQQPEYESLKQRDLSFQGQAGVDMIDIQDDGLFYRVSSILKEPINDPAAYAGKATLAWTHSTYCQKTPEIFSLFNKKVCIIRDPRDRVLSSAKFAFTDYMQKRYPSSYSSPEDFLEHEYERLLEQWVWFYGNYFLHKDELDIHFVFYEGLLDNFSLEFDLLLKYLDLELSPSEKQQLKAAVSFSSMKADSPRHLQKGRSRKWVEQLTIEQQQKAVEIAGPLMRIFGYATSPEQEDNPAIPAEDRDREVEKIVSSIDWRGLF